MSIRMTRRERELAERQVVSFILDAHSRKITVRYNDGHELVAGFRPGPRPSSDEKKDGYINLRETLKNNSGTSVYLYNPSEKENETDWLYGKGVKFCQRVPNTLDNELEKLRFRFIPKQAKRAKSKNN